jgi:DNA uptake protein ComE-like DNA-binding protein
MNGSPSHRAANTSPHRPGMAPHRPGMALLIVMVLTMLVALAAYRFSFYMESQYRLARLTEEQLQARLAALSGLEYAAYLLEQPGAERSWQSERENLASYLAAVPIVTDQEEKAASSQPAGWRFSLIAPLAHGPADAPMTAATAQAGQGTQHRFGFENESAKLSVPLLLQWERITPGTARTALLRLPGTTPQLVDQWLRLQGISNTDPSNASRPGIDPVNASANQPNVAVEDRFEDQLQWLWYGGDLNQNYRLDPLELQLRGRLFRDQSRGGLGMDSNRENEPARGWNRYLTWTSGQRNQSASGQPRINLNSSDLPQLHRQLLRSWPIEWANFVLALRQFGPAANRASTTVSAASVSLNLARPATYRITSLLDLVDVHVRVIGEDAAAPTQTLHSPFAREPSSATNYLARLLDEASLDNRPFIEHTIDINEAPIEVLAAVPGLGVELAQAIVQRRAGLDATRRNTIAWLYTEQVLTLDQLRRLEPYFIARSDVYHIQSVGFRAPKSPLARYTAVIDARHIPARLLSLQQWHNWDRGFDLQTLGAEPATGSGQRLSALGDRLPANIP